MRLLIAEDDVRLLKSLKHIFEKEQYLVDAVSNGTDALEYALTGEYDGIVLDVMMPGIDGIEVLKRLRAGKIRTPVLLLTAKAEVSHRVEGLDAGADDYLPKPFATQELLARVRAMLRRKETYLPELLSVSDFHLNRSTYTLSREDRSVKLSSKEFQILELLMQSPNVVIPTDRLICHVWGWDSNAEVNTLWVHISNLRKKMTTLGTSVEIRFLRSAGYILEDKG